MKKRILSLVVAMIACFGFCFALVGCSEHEQIYQITFNSQGGSAVRDYEGFVEKEPVPDRDGFFFRGWYLDEDYNGDRINFPFYVEKDVVLYAKWEKDTRTPAEKYIDAGRNYTAQFSETSFSFEYDSNKEKINVIARYFPSGWDSIYFKLEYEFAMGDLGHGVGKLTGTNCNYTISLSSGSYKNVYISFTLLSGTDWLSTADLVGVQAKFVKKIPTAFEEFYKWCYDNYGLDVY